MRYRQVLSLNGVDYPLLSFRQDRIRPQRVAQLATGALRWDENLGAYRFKITDFSGPLGQSRIEMESPRQGHVLGALAPTMSGTMGYLTGVPGRTGRIDPDSAISTTRAIVPSGVCIASDVEDPGDDPFHYVAVGNEVWRSVQGTVKFQDKGTANAAVSTTDTTLTDTRESWSTNEWVGMTVTCNGKTLTVTSNDSDTLTGSGGWSGGGNPGNGNAWEMHNSVLTFGSATQIGAMVETLSVDGSNLYKRIYVAAASASGDLQIYYLGASGAPWNDDASWHAATDAASNAIKGEALTVAGAWMNTSPTTAVYHDAVTIGTVDGLVNWAVPYGAYAATSTGSHFVGPGRIQFLSQRFYDIRGQGIFLISGGKLYNMYFPKSSMPSFRPTPPLPPVYCGTMWQNTPVVSDGGLAMYQVVGLQTRRLDIPPNLMADYNARNSKSFRAGVRFLSAAGDLLLAGLRVTDGTDYHLLLASFNAAIKQWRILWAYDGSTNDSDFLGSYLGPTKSAANVTGAEKNLVICYMSGSNSYVDTIQLPRGLAGQTGSDDSFSSNDRWTLPEFDGGDATLDGTMLGYRILWYSSAADNPQLSVLDAMDGGSYSQVASLVPSIGWNENELLLASGQGESFKRCSILLSPQLSAVGNDHPEIHEFEYIFRKRGDAARDYVFDIDMDSWIAEGNTYAQFWSNIETAFEKEPLPAMSVKSEGVATLISQRYVSVENVEVLPHDPRHPRAARILCRETL